MKNISSTAIIIAIVFLGLGFGLGTVYQKSQKTSFANFGNAPAGMTRGSGRGGNGQFTGANNVKGNAFRPVVGEILSADDKSITVKLADGSSKIVLLTDKTAINKAQVATKTDLKTGEKVSVFGQTNTDGSVSAQNIQLNPLDRAMGQQIAPKAAN